MNEQQVVHLHLIDKVMGSWYIWPYEGDRENGTRVLRTNEALAGPFGTRGKAFEAAMHLAVKGM